MTLERTGPEVQPDEILWRVHLNASPERVFELISTDPGRSTFWAEETRQVADSIEFRFPNGETLLSRIIAIDPTTRLTLTYFGGSTVSFELQQAGSGTDLTVHERGASDPLGNSAGWVSVLLQLKATADHGVDLRNHDLSRTWDSGFVDN